MLSALLGSTTAVGTAQQDRGAGSREEAVEDDPLASSRWASWFEVEELLPEAATREAETSVYALSRIETYARERQ